MKFLPTGGDDTAALQQAVYASQSAGEVLELAPLVYRIDGTVTIPVDSQRIFRMRGAASNTVGLSHVGCGTRIIGNGLGIKLHVRRNAPSDLSDPTAQTYFELADFSMIPGVGAEGAYGIRIGQDYEQLTGLNKSLMENVRVNGFGLGIGVINTRQVHFERVSVVMPGAGATQCLNAYVQNASRFTGDLTFYNCEFTGSGDPAARTMVLTSGAPGAEVRGIHLTDTTLYYSKKCLQMYASGGGVIADIFVDTCAFDGAAGFDPDTEDAISVDAVGAGSMVGGVSISKTYMVNWKRAAVVFAANDGGVVRDCSVSGSPAIGLCRHAVLAWNAMGVKVQGNSLTDIGNDPATDGAITFGGQCLIGNVSGNTHTASPYHGIKLAHLVRVEAGNSDFLAVHGNSGHHAQAAVLNLSSGSNNIIGGNC